MRLLALVACVAVAGCLDVVGSAPNAGWVAELRKAGIEPGLPYVGRDDAGEFTSHGEASAFVSRQRGQRATFAGNLMQARKSGVFDVVHWRPYGMAKACIPNNPTGQCLNSRGGLPKMVVRCKGQSWSSLMKATGGEIAKSANNPWTRRTAWEHVAVVGRVSRVTRGSTNLGDASYAAAMGRPDFGLIGAPRGMTFVFSVIELTNCRLATFRKRAVTGG